MICSKVGFEGYKYMMGISVGIDFEEIIYMKLFIFWGINVVSINMY